MLACNDGITEHASDGTIQIKYFQLKVISSQKLSCPCGGGRGMEIV